MFPAAEQGQHLHVPGVWRRAAASLGCQVGAAAHDLGERRILRVPQTRAPRLMRVKEIPEPTSPCLGFQLLENRRVEVRIASGGHLCLVQLLRG
jgi:hypothetical protein